MKVVEQKSKAISATMIDFANLDVVCFEVRKLIDDFGADTIVITGQRFSEEAEVERLCI